MPAADRLYLAQWLRQRAGLHIDPQNQHWLDIRLKSVARRFGFRDVDALLRELPYGRPALDRDVLDAMTIHDTWFFRDRAQFKLLRDELLPDLLTRCQATKHLRIWCAAVSTGQEIYTLAMLLKELRLVESGWKIDLFGSDLSEACIKRARLGRYSTNELGQGLGLGRKLTYFRRDGQEWCIADTLRHMVHFQTLNLLDDFSHLGEMNLILCRNVLFYFDPLMRQNVLSRLSCLLAPHGHLITSVNEYLDPETTQFQRHHHVEGVYRRLDHVRHAA